MTSALNRLEHLAALPPHTAIDPAELAVALTGVPELGGWRVTPSSTPADTTPPALAVTYATGGAVAGYPVPAGDAAASAITVYPR